MKPVTTWILLANAQTARIVRNLGPGKGVEPVEGAVLHAPSPTEYSDRPGSVQNSATQSHSAVKRRAPKELAAQAFAELVLRYLEEASQNDTFDRLIVTSAPKLLGDLRARMSQGLRKRILAEIDKDLTQVTLDELPEYLGDVLAA